MAGPLVGPLIAAGASLIGTGTNAMVQGKMNKRTERFNTNQSFIQNLMNRENWKDQNEYNESMWSKQNDYNQKIWEMQNRYNEGLWEKENDYNSPLNQMKRFREAGLNPNLIYGQSNTGGSISTATLQSDRQSSASHAGATGAAPVNFRAPDLSPAPAMMAYMQARQMQAQTDNVKAQTIVAQRQAEKTAADTAQTIANTDYGSELHPYNVDAMKLKLEQATQDLSFQFNQEERAAISHQREGESHKASLLESAQRILNMRGQQITEALKQELMMYDANLKSLGIQPTDNMIFRILGQTFRNPQFKSWIKNSWSGSRDDNSNY